MKLRVYGNSHKVDKNLVRTAMFFYMDTLLGAETDDLTLHVKFVDGLIKTKNSKARSWPSVTAFKIEVDAGLGRIQTLRCLAHEIVHIKQFACRELAYHPTDNCIALWNGEEMEWNQQDMNIYYNTPWEIEANGREVALYELFKIHLHHLKNG